MQQKQKTLSLVMVAMFAALTAIGAFIKVPLPVVPFTLQIVFVFLAGCLLGSRNGLLSQLVYIGIGLVGLPVFTQGGGITYVMQPTFGFLIGFALAALVIGWLLEKVDIPTKRHFMFANSVGLLLIYAIAVPYLYVSLNFWLDVQTSWSHVFLVGFLNSIVADFCLSIVSAFLAERLYKVFRSARVIEIKQIIKENA